MWFSLCQEESVLMLYLNAFGWCKGTFFGVGSCKPGVLQGKALVLFFFCKAFSTF